MTSKIKAFIAATGAAIVGYINWLVTVPPEQQAGALADMVNLIPIDWRPDVGLATRTLMFFLTIYATTAASHSGPQTPPKNPPTE